MTCQTSATFLESSFRIQFLSPCQTILDNTKDIPQHAETDTAQNFKAKRKKTNYSNKSEILKVITKVLSKYQTHGWFLKCPAETKQSPQAVATKYNSLQLSRH